MESFSKLYWNVMERVPTSTSPMPWSIDVARWEVNGANFGIPINFAYMCRNLTWLDNTHAFIVWEGVNTQGCMSFPHNIWDFPHLHQRSSCSLIVIIRHSHLCNLCQNSLEMSWNVFLHSHHQCHDPPTSHVDLWMGPMFKFLQIVLVYIKIWHGWIRHMPSWCGRVWRLKESWRTCKIFDIVHVCINVHHVVSWSWFVIPINGIFVETLLKCHGMCSNKHINNSMIHRHCTLSSDSQTTLKFLQIVCVCIKIWHD